MLTNITSFAVISLLWQSLLAQSFPAADFAQGPLKVSENQRFLVFSDGKPFFWLGDTAWELFHRLDREEIKMYFEDRQAKGFTVIQAVILAEQDGLNTPNAKGDKPFIDNDPYRPNEAYFAYVDEVIQIAEDHGLLIALLPTWGDKVFKQKWGIGPVVFNPDNARTYGQYLGKRYRDVNNIVWVIGGDRVGEGYENIWDNMAEGILKEDDRHLMTYHPRGNFSSSVWFHERDWLDFNMLQSSHSDKAFNFKMVQADYELEPTKPVIDSEPCYEYIPIGFKPEQGRINAYEVRRAAYWSLFAGSFGHTYGANPIWQMYDEGREGIITPDKYWHEVLDLPGARQMTYVRALMESRDHLSRVPDQDLIACDNTLTRNHMRATRGKDYVMVYCPMNDEVSIRMGKISGEKVHAWWFNPRDGSSQRIGTFENNGVQTFRLPVDGPDWLLVLDDIKSGYSVP